MYGRGTKRLVVALGLLAGLAAGCGDGGSGPEGPARVTVLLTDAPGDLTAWVAIKEIYLQGGAGGRTVLATFDPARVVELTALANSTTELVNEQEVPEGTYSELRVVISGGCIKVEEEAGPKFYATDLALCDGGTQAGGLQMPSFGSSGLKVKFDEPLEFAGGETPLLIDFDVAQSFGKQAGNSGKWVMSPVVKGATLSSAGGVTVTLQKPAACPLSLGDFKAELRAGDATSGEKRSFTDADANQVFEASFKYTLPGAYKVALIAPSGATPHTPTPTLPAGVTVTAGAPATVAISLTCP